MRKAVVTLDGRPILTDLSFFTRIRKNDDLGKAQATGRVTAVPVPRDSGHKIVLEFGGGIFRY